MKLIDMKMAPAEPAEDAGYATPAAQDLPKYPWGLQICLENDSLEKLGLPLPVVGQELTLIAKVSVTSVSSNETEGGGQSNCVTLQITDMAVQDPQRDYADALFGTAKS